VCGSPLTVLTTGSAKEVSGTLSLEQLPPLVEILQTPTCPAATVPHEKGSAELPTVPGYEILGVLGRGGMGVVYKARQISLNRLVALKMVSAGVHASPQQLARFHLEAEAVASLQHPNIVQIYEVSEHNRCPYFSLEFMDGGSLDKHFAGQPQPPRSAAELVETLARAMHCAHQRGVIHRDLKPANILLQSILTAEDTEERRDRAASVLPLRSSVSSAVKHFIPKITDFGLAKRLEDAGQTQSGTILGTPSYMSPEQARGRDEENRPGRRCVCAGGDPLRAAHGPAAVPERKSLPNRSPGAHRGAGAAPPASSESAGRPGDHLPEVSREGARQSLCQRGSPGRRFAPLSGR
jgi:serine/threonine protein kinase